MIAGLQDKKVLSENKSFIQKRKGRLGCFRTALYCASLNVTAVEEREINKNHYLRSIHACLFLFLLICYLFYFYLPVTVFVLSNLDEV